MEHNAILAALSLGLQLPLALGVALLLNRPLRGTRIFRLIFFTPYVLSEAITAILFLQILQPDNLVDAMLRSVGLGGLVQLWLADLRLVFYTLFVVITWKYIGFAIILLLAGLQGIPCELHEAAAMDGASSWETLRYVTLPLLGPTIRIWAFLCGHRLDPALRPGLDHDPRRAGRLLLDDGHLHDRPGRQQLPDRLCNRGRRDPVPPLLRHLDPVPGLRPAPGRRRRDGEDGRARWPRRRTGRAAGAEPVRRRAGVLRGHRARGRRARADRLCRAQRVPHDGSARGEAGRPCRIRG